MIKKRNKYFSIKNYYTIIFICLGTLLLTWYVISWQQVKTKEKFLTSYLITTNTLNNEIKDLKEIEQILSESPTRYFVYISYTQDESIYKLEKKLKKLIDNYEIKDEFYYINVTNQVENANLINELNKKFDTQSIENIPCILYFENGQLKETLLDKNKVFDYSKFEKLLKEKKYEKSH